MKHQATSTKHHSTTSTNAVDNAIIFDTTLPKTAINLYCILVSLCGDNTNKVSVSISQLAELLGRSDRTICTRLNDLIDAGLIERIHCSAPNNPKWNMPSLFVIHNRVRNGKGA